MPIGLVTSAGPWGKRYEELEWYGSTYDNIRAGAFDGKARLDDQDIDGVEAEVLYPSQRTMGTFMAQPDDDYHLAGIDAYNQWMHDEFMAADPQRLIGLYQMPAVDIDVSVAKLARGEEPRLPRRDHLARTRAATRRSPTTTTRSGRRPRKRASRSTSTSV